MKLKTLKDIFEQDEKNAGGFITAQILREETTKWIKELRNPEKFSFNQAIALTPNSDFVIDIQRIIDKEIIIDWIKHFFNIKEEDLK